MSSKTYLDHNATTPPRNEVIQITQKAMASPHNASSIHAFGREGRKYIEQAREQIALLTNAPATQIIFNSGATEGNNTVLQHFAGERILASAIEHPAVLEAVKDVEHIPVTPQGLVDLNELENLLKDKKTGLVSIMLVNNETGIIQPVKEAAALSHKYGALFHCDAVQAAGRIPIDIARLGIDFMTLSAHKIGGPQGVGALILGICGVTPTLLTGGGQEKSARAGTENVAGIAGFGVAAKLAHQELQDFQKNTRPLQQKLENALNAMSGIQIYDETERVTNTTLFSIPGISSETLVMSLDLENIAVSNGSACSSGKVKPSHVLKAMARNNKEATSAIRISTGWNTSENDIDRFLEVWQNIYQRMKDKIDA